MCFSKLIVRFSCTIATTLGVACFALVGVRHLATRDLCTDCDVFEALDQSGSKSNNSVRQIRTRIVEIKSSCDSQFIADSSTMTAMKGEEMVCEPM